MSTGESQQATLGGGVADAVNAAREEIESGIPAASGATGDGKPALPAAPEKAWEIPGWAKNWKEPSRKALEALYANEGNRAHWDPIQKELDGAYGYIGRRDQEYAQYRQAMDPIWQTVSPLEQAYGLQGMSLQQGLSRMIQAGNFLATQPDQAFPWFAQSYKPNDPGKVLQALAKQWGADVSQLWQDAYVDPNISALLTPLQQEVQALKQERQQARMMQQQQYQRSILGQIEQFENAKDESGNPLYPHFERVYDRMTGLLNGKLAQGLEDAYEQAILLDKELVAEIAQKRAQEEAAARAAAAEKAIEASKTVAGKGKPNSSEKRAKSIAEAVRMARAERGD